MFFAFVWLTLLSVKQSNGQLLSTQKGVPLDPSKSITQYGHLAWTTKHGLPQNTISAIVQTPDGYVWLATQEGLVQYDGVTFRTFDRKNTKVFTANIVNQLVTDDAGTLWIGTRGGGLISYAKGVFKSKTEEDGLSSEFATALFADPGNGVWLGTFLGGLNHVTEKGITVYGEGEGLPGRNVTFVSRNINNQLIAGTDLGVFVLKHNKFEPHPDADFAKAFVTAYFLDSTGSEWIGLRDGSLHRKHLGAVLDFSEPIQDGSSYIKAIFEDQSGSIWFGSRGNGLFRYAQGQVSAFKEENGLSDNIVLSLFQGRDGELWVGTGNGLDRLQDGKFTTFTEAEGLANNYVLTVHEDASGALWSGTKGGGLSRYLNGNFTTFTTANGLSSNQIQSVLSDRSGNVWVGTADAGINRITSTGIDRFTVENGLAGNEIYAQYLDSKGRMWIGTGTGISIYDAGKFSNITQSDGLGSEFITDFEERADGGMWIGTYDQGLNLYLGDSLQVFTTEDGLGHNGIFSLHSDSDGALWVGTFGGGLNRISKGKVTGISSEQGLFDDLIVTILEDNAGFFWFSSNKGIFKVKKDELDAVMDGRLDRVNSIVYGVSDGMKTAETNGGQQPAAWRAKDGKLWFPTALGLAGIQPNNIPINNAQPLLDIHRLIADREVISLLSDIVLKAGSDKLEFSYVGLSFPAPEKVLYEIMLEGHDSEWSNVGTRREAFYTNLGPGEYTFRVRATNNDGIWSSQDAHVSFVIKPFFYQTTWFLLVCVIVVISGTYFAYRTRIAHMRARERELEILVDERTVDLRREKEMTEKAKEIIEEQAEQLRELDKFKTKFFSNVSHEFRTPLTMLIGPLENALNGAYGAVSDTMRQQAEIMLRNAQRLMRLINQLLDLSKLEAGKMQLKARVRNIVPFLEGMLYTFTPFTEKKNIELKFECDLEEIEVYFEPDHMEKIFYNLLSNAAKFTPKNGSISLQVTKEDPDHVFKEGSVLIRVSDTGMGMPEEDLPFIFDRFKQSEGSHSTDQQGTGIGLSLVKELVLLHKGEIQVESTVGVGTSFILQLHIGKNHLRDEEVVIESLGDESTLSTALPELAANSLNFVDADDPSLVEPVVELPLDAATVLVVEDNKDVREYVASILQTSHRIVQAEDGQDGLDKAIALVPDLIISDVTMPRMDGTEMCRRIKLDERTNHIPVLLLTARASFEGKISGLEVGADDYMAKPFNARELQIRVKNLIKLRNQDKELKVLNEDLENQVQEQLQLILKEREAYEQQLIVARDRAESSSRLKSSILDNINHEFRTPLATILGYSQILIEEAPKDMLEFANAIEEGGQRLLKTLNGVIDLASIESMDYDADRQRTNVASVLQKLMDEISHPAESKALKVEVRNDIGKDVEIDVSPLALEKTLAVLLDNAVKFSDKGNIVLGVSRSETHIRFSVSDEGLGIDPESLERIFIPFIQGDLGLSRRHEGCGVGLSIAQRLAERMGSDLTVQSTKGMGSTFAFSLPIVERRSTPKKRRSVSGFGTSEKTR